MAVKGTFQDISFIEMLQLVDQGRKTGRMEVSCNEKWAMIVFQDGVVWHVEPRGFRGLSPEEVIYELIGTEEGKFVYQRLQLLPTLERTVNMSTKSLILEGAKRLDDRRQFIPQDDGSGNSTTQDQCLRLKPDYESKVRYAPQNVKKVLAAIDGERCISEVVEKSQVEATQAAQIIKDLISQDVVELFTPTEELEKVPEIEVAVGE